VFDLAETYIERRPRSTGQPLSILRNCYVEKGDLSDWKQLHELHYKSSNLGIGPRYMRLVLEDYAKREIIGCMVFTVPKPLDSGRNEVFPHLKPNRNGKDNTLINKQRMMWLNRNLILSSRTVLDTMYRGAGLAYRFKNIGYRLMGYRFVESRSSMSRYNPFSLKAGMRFVSPKPAAALMDGLRFFQRHFKSAGYDYVGVRDELAAMPEHLRARVIDELRTFYYAHSSMEKSGDNRLNGTSRVEQMELGYLLKQTQQLVFGSTVYAVWKNPDYDEAAGKMRPLPARIPVLAFDLQRPDQPLRLDQLGSLQ
jgi:ABC-type ATPase with predicted acetyltransferase domain